MENKQKNQDVSTRAEAGMKVLTPAELQAVSGGKHHHHKHKHKKKRVGQVHQNNGWNPN